MRSICSRSVVSSLVALALFGACAVSEDPVIVPPPEEVDDDTPDPDGNVEFEVGDDVDALSALAPAATRHVYGTSVQGQSLVYFKITPPAPNGKRAFLTFALHGFEDAWKQDGRALYSIAHKAINYYGNDPSQLNGWTLYIVPTGNPDGMRFGTNNWRETAGAYGRCTSQGKDLNRHVSSGTSSEQRKLTALFDQVKPTIAIDFHGWYNTYYGNSRIGGFFQRSFNAAYDGKPAKYCFVASSGAMDCGSTLGGIFHASTSISTDLFAEWATRARGVPAALVEYPAPDFNLNGSFDTVWDAELGYRRLGKVTLQLLWSRTRVALNNLFDEY
jgi:hypothetical protein